MEARYEIDVLPNLDTTESTHGSQKWIQNRAEAEEKLNRLDREGWNVINILPAGQIWLVLLQHRPSIGVIRSVYRVSSLRPLNTHRALTPKSFEIDSSVTLSDIHRAKEAGEINERSWLAQGWEVVCIEPAQDESLALFRMRCNAKRAQELEKERAEYYERQLNR